jgi:dienelactone hydrolase
MNPANKRVLRPPVAPVHGTLFLPETGEPRGAAVLIGGSGGSEPTYAAELLPSAGIAALSLAYFKRPRLPTRLRKIRLEYFRDALRLLVRALPSGNIPVVVLGMSRGSEAALLSAAYFREFVDGVVASVPSNLVLCSSPPGSPAWLLNGKPLPYVSHFGPHTEDPASIIPVERIRGPILLVSAGADQVWPSAAMARAVSQRLGSFGHVAGHEILEYPEATHSLGYLIPNLPSGLLPSDLFDWPADKAARSDAWPRIVDFILNCPAGRRVPRP